MRDVLTMWMGGRRQRRRWRRQCWWCARKFTSAPRARPLKAQVEEEEEEAGTEPSNFRCERRNQPRREPAQETRKTRWRYLH